MIGFLIYLAGALFVGGVVLTYIRYSTPEYDRDAFDGLAVVVAALFWPLVALYGLLYMGAKVVANRIGPTVITVIKMTEKQD